MIDKVVYNNTFRCFLLASLYSIIMHQVLYYAGGISGVLVLAEDPHHVTCLANRCERVRAAVMQSGCETSIEQSLLAANVLVMTMDSSDSFAHRCQALIALKS